jgi:hypothetical protein
MFITSLSTKNTVAQNSTSNGNGQNSNSNNGNSHQITYLTNPKNCGWYAVWKNPNDNSTNKRWRVQILQKTTSSTGITSYTVIEEFEQNKNYYQIPESYRNNGNIAIRVSNPSNANINNNNDDVLETCPGCETGITEQVFKCNGLSYAFEIKKIKNSPSSANHYLSLSSTENYYDELSGTSIPFYRYVSPSTFQQHFSFLHTGQYDILYNVQNSNNILDINGNPLTGTVYALIKDLGPFNGASFTTSFLADEIVYQNISHMIMTFNTYAPIINNSRPPLSCTPYPSSPNSGGGISWFGFYRDYLYDFFYNEKNRKKIAEIIKLLAINDPLYSTAQTPTGTIYSVNNYNQFTIQRIDKASAPITIAPSDIYTNNGIVYPNIELENGIYKFTVWTANNEIIPIYFESNEQLLGNNKQSDKVKIIILPVPIKENRFIVRLEANERVSFEFKLLDDKGRILHNSNHELNANEIQNHEVQFTPYPDASKLLINRFTFEDASEKIIKTISQ